MRHNSKHTVTADEDTPAPPLETVRPSEMTLRNTLICSDSDVYETSGTSPDSDVSSFKRSADTWYIVNTDLH